MKLFNFTPKFNLSTIFTSKDEEKENGKPFKFQIIKSLRRKKAFPVEDNVYFYTNTILEPIKFNDPIILKLEDSVKGLNYRCICDGDCTCSFKSVLPSFDFCDSSDSSPEDSLCEPELIPSAETLELMSIMSNPTKKDVSIKSALKKSVLTTPKSSHIDIVFPFEESNGDCNLTTELKRFTGDFSQQFVGCSSSTLASTETNVIKKELRFNEQAIVFETFSKVDYPRTAIIDPTLTDEEHFEIYYSLAEYKSTEMVCHPDSINNLNLNY